MRLDHYAIRCHDRLKAAQFYVEAFGYKIQEHFEIDLDDGQKAKCVALTPPEAGTVDALSIGLEPMTYGVFHKPPEVFISDGTPDSVVGKWVAKYGGGIGQIHHVAYAVEDVTSTMRLWKKNGWAEFTTEEPIYSEELIQCFTKPHPFTGVTYEFIKRLGNVGFNKNNVKALMQSTINNEGND